MTNTRRARRRAGVVVLLASLLVAGAWTNMSASTSTSTSASASASVPRLGTPPREAGAVGVTRGRPRLAAHRARTVVGVAHCTFVDTSRTTYDYTNGATLPTRTLLTEIRYPAVERGSGPVATEVRGAPAEYRRGPFPTIFFAPGYDVTPDNYAALLDAWTRAGFVVVGVTFPDTNPSSVAAATAANPSSDPEDDIVNQPADLAFVVRSVLAASQSRQPDCRVLDGLVDPAALGVAGQSDGGDTVAMLSYDQAPQYASLTSGFRLRAAAVMSGSEEPSAGPYEATAGDPALLVVQSATDQCNPPEASTAFYDAVVQPDKWYLDLFHADHLPPYDGFDIPAFTSVAAVTTRFFRLELRGAVPAAGFLAFGAQWPSVAALTTGSSAPGIAPLPFELSACTAR